jgi:hypothetical protein
MVWTSVMWNHHILYCLGWSWHITASLMHVCYRQLGHRKWTCYGVIFVINE